MPAQSRIDGGVDVFFEVTYKVIQPEKGLIRSFVKAVCAKDAASAKTIASAALESEFHGTGTPFKITKVVKFN